RVLGLAPAPRTGPARCVHPAPWGGRSPAARSYPTARSRGRRRWAKPLSFPWKTFGPAVRKTVAPGQKHLCSEPAALDGPKSVKTTGMRAGTEDVTPRGGYTVQVSAFD